MAQATTQTVSISIPERSAFSWKNLWIALAIITVFEIAVNVYERTFAISKGLDYFTPQYQTYWMSILYTELILEPTTLIALCSWLWVTRDRAMENLAPAEELRRYWNLGLFVVVYIVLLYWGASYYTEQDGTWHQTVIRDTDFTPSHIIEFYQSYPIYIVAGVGSMVYAMTRLPQYAKAFSVPYAVLVGSPLMIFPNVGLNEFGHTRWFMEELFVAPLHWGFVMFGWGALAILGVWLQICPRVVELIKQVYYGKPATSPAVVLNDPEKAADPALCEI
ncbi:methane monooxygenase/ammonia monooxygenase subunit C [Candidatus Methylacidiphilum infernorum]|uniref:Methane monooxygenase/ammonia monooxygenase subunit C n=1 Tax=Candidatus Methylacidiphilum infernorum TaxID=511746 RepID=A0ABX7PWK1_9BACT|nr:bacterial ammonia monooxygenase, subunit AmoC [Candidatus Methylacidiphilum infernorum]QSR87103.1 methane monooxygenase/ammonia monooxygenase subunit C [Candidatus Methylacidiphilum infernorum]